MEIDSDLEDQPVVKRKNIPDAKHNPRSRTMMADRVEVGHQLGKRIDDGYGGNIRERLGMKLFFSRTSLSKSFRKI